MSQEFVSIATFPAKKIPRNAVQDSEGILHYVKHADLIRVFLDLLHVRHKLTVFGEEGNLIKDGDAKIPYLLEIVKQSKTDLVMVEIGLTEERFDAVNISYPLRYSQDSFATDKPRPLPTHLALVHPFSIEMWITLTVILTMITFCFYIFSNRNQSYFNTASQIFGSLIQKSVNFKKDRSSFRVLLVAWLFSAMIISHSYAAVLLSFLSSPTMTGIKDIEDLAAAGRDKSFKCFSLLGSYLQQNFLESNETSRVMIGECMKRTRMLYGNETFRTASPGKAYVGPFLDPYRYNYFVSEDSFSFSMQGYPYSKNFCCPKRLNTIIHRMFAVGLFDKFERDMAFSDKMLAMSRALDSSATVKKLTLEDLSLAFYILICGCILASLIFILEILVNKISKKVNK